MAIQTLSPTSPSPHYMLGRTTLPLASVQFPELDGSIFASPELFRFDADTWTFTRDAQGQYGMVHTANAATVHGVLSLSRILYNKIGSDPLIGAVGAEYWSGYSDPSSLPGGGGGGSAGVAQPGVGHYFRGVQVSGFDLIYKVGTLALTSAALTLNRSVFANNAAPVTTQPGGVLTGTHQTATQAQPYVSRFTPATPYVIGNNVADQSDDLEITWVFQASTTYELYGANVYFNYVLL